MRCLLLLIFFMPLHVLATHIVGGEISYTYLGDDIYEVHLLVYRDCGPTNPNETDFDSEAALGIYDNNNLAFPYITLQLPLSEAIVTELPSNFDNPCVILPPEICVQKADYSATVLLPPSAAGYSLAYQRCCRNIGLVNIASNDDIGGTYWTQIPAQAFAEGNSNPEFNQLPPLAICAGIPFEFDHSATDIDGDSLVYTLCPPLYGGGIGNYQPNPPDPPAYVPVVWLDGFSDGYQITSDPAITIDSETGMITGTPTAAGAYVFGICVQEYRNGVLLSETNRDFQITVTICGGVQAQMGEFELCTGLEVDFDNLIINDAEVFWDFGELNLEADTSIESSPSWNYTDYGDYDVTLISNPGLDCADTTVQTISVQQPILLEADVLGGECVPGGRLYLIDDNSTFPENTDILWDFGPGTDPDSFTGGDPGEFISTASGTNTVFVSASTPECTSIFTITHEIPPFPTVSLSAQETWCGELDVPFASTMTDQISFIWDFDHAFNGTDTLNENLTHTFPGYGQYDVTLIVDPGTTCADTALTTIEISDPNPIQFTYAIQDPGPCSADTTINGQWLGEGANQITWDLGNGDEVNTSDFEIDYGLSGWYDITLTVYNEICDQTASETVTIYNEEQPIIFPLELPNVFSPNGDGRNDYFRPFFAVSPGIPYVFQGDKNVFDYLEVWEIKIYNRWGALVFDSEDGLDQWDGNSDGKTLSDGTFYAIVRYKRACVNEEVQTTSMSFELLR